MTTKKATTEHNIQLLEKQIARKLHELALLKGETNVPLTDNDLDKIVIEAHKTDQYLEQLAAEEATRKAGETMNNESVKTETVEATKAETEKKTLRATAVGWLTAAWSAVVAFAGKTWSNMTETFDNVVLNPIVHQVAFGAAFLYGIAESIWLLAGNFSAVALMAMPFEVVVSTIVLGASAVGLAFLSMFAVTSLKDVTVGAWNKTASAASTAWNWMATPFRKSETTEVEAPKTEAPKTEPMKSEEDGFDSKRAAARETTKLVPDTSNASLAAIGV